MAERNTENATSQNTKGIWVACDVNTTEEFYNLARRTAGVEGISGYKVGLTAHQYGLERVVKRMQDISGLDVVYDAQKAGNDIPEMGKQFAKMCKGSGIRKAILYPLAGPVTETAWTKALQDADIVPMVGGEMTHKGFTRAEGGNVSREDSEGIYKLAVEIGVDVFGVPGNKVEAVAHYKALLDEALGEGKYTLFAPGFVKQGGVITDMARVAGDNWIAVVGSAIYGARRMRKAAEEMTSQLRAA